MALVKKQVFIEQYLKHFKELLGRFLPDEDCEFDMLKMSRLIITGEIRHIEEAQKGVKNG